MLLMNVFYYFSEVCLRSHGSPGMLMSFVEREEGNFEDDDNVRSQLFGVPKRRICNFTQKNRRAYLTLKSFESCMERLENGIGKRK